MVVRGKLSYLSDYFVPADRRTEKCVYFYRVNGYTLDIDAFIKKYFDAASRFGMVIEGNIPNPTEKNLEYYNEVMGMNFRKDREFISSGLKKWLPRMNAYQNETVAASMYNALDRLEKSGKNANMLKNAYIKFMCWLYYKFEPVINKIDGRNGSEVPKILYEGTISKYELMLVSMLCECGCDVLLLQYSGDAEYLKLDPCSDNSDILVLPDMTSFPEGYCIRKLRENARNKVSTEAISSLKSESKNYTNTWIQKHIFEDIRTPYLQRGDDSSGIYNCFFRINGVDDKLAYENELYNLREELKNCKRNFLIIENRIPLPDNSEINAVRRENYASAEQMIRSLATNINFSSDMALQKIMKKAFTDVMAEEYKISQNINKETGKAVYLLCWLRRYQSELFKNRSRDSIGCFIYLGGCKNGNEAAFVKMLAKLPLDVLILTPNLDSECVLRDSTIYEESYRNSYELEKYPSDKSELHVGTVAYNAERELDTIMYTNTGIYRSHQYATASARVLETTYEEIAILWNQELKYRPNFREENSSVDIPVIFAKVSGVKDKDIFNYWCSIKNLMTEDAFVVKAPPFINPAEFNPVKQYAHLFLKNGKLQRDVIKSHKCYQYGYLREEMQDHILDKIQMLLDSKLISGTYRNGTEYVIVATGLNINQKMIRVIQKFDFTKKNPKIIYINTSEVTISSEDSIMMALFSLIGFDVVFFVPTGYRSVENNYTKKPFAEHCIGDYVYDLDVPDFSTFQTRRSIKELFFGKNV